MKPPAQAIITVAYPVTVLHLTPRNVFLQRFSSFFHVFRCFQCFSMFFNVFQYYSKAFPLFSSFWFVFRLGELLHSSPGDITAGERDGAPRRRGDQRNPQVDGEGSVGWSMVSSAAWFLIWMKQ